jgi:hypothetical protein
MISQQVIEHRRPRIGPGGPITLATAFEQQLRKLGLNERNCAGSRELRKWFERNKDRCYILECLLKEWKMRVNPYLNINERAA